MSQIQNLCLVGAIPPPYGGVTVHLRRLLDALHSRNIRVSLFDISGQTKIAEGVTCMRWRTAVWRLLFQRRSIVHFHNFGPRNLYLYALLGMRHRTLLTLHNERFHDELAERGSLERRLLIWAFNRLDCIVVVNEKCTALAKGIVRDYAKVRVVPTFIPPPESDNGDLSEPMKSLRDRHRILIASTAYQLQFHDGQDLYGIDMMVELTNRLIIRHRLDVATVVLLPAPANISYFEQLQQRVRDLKIEERFVFLTEPIDDATALWKAADIVIRATNTDGDSLTVLEALSVGTPVIASDCAPRHSEVTLFATRDSDDLERVTVGMINDLDSKRQELRGLTIGNGVERLIGIYEEMMT